MHANSSTVLLHQMKELISAPIPSRLLIDVREPAEVAQSGRIPGSVLMPINSNPDAVYLDPEDFEEEFGFEKPGQKEDGTAQGPDEVVFYCRIGVRSKVAMQQALGEGGWKGIKAGEYGGGMIEWAGKGGEVERIGKKMAA